jgi:serine/threonine-protein kinase
MIAGRFRIEKILGRGGMGEVLLAQDTLLNRRVALKRIRPERDEGEAQRGAILR